MRDFIELIEEFFTSVFNFNVFIGIVAAIIVFIIEINYMNKHSKKNKKVEKAKELGNVVTAKKIHAWSDNIHGTTMNTWEYATYVYEVDGKSYRYEYMEREIPPARMTLYYINNPRKAFTEKENKHLLSSLMFYVVPIAVAVIIINLLGGV